MEKKRNFSCEKWWEKVILENREYIKITLWKNLLESTVSWFHSELDQLQSEKYLPPNYELNFKYYLEK